MPSKWNDKLKLGMFQACFDFCSPSSVRKETKYKKNDKLNDFLSKFRSIIFKGCKIDYL